MRMMTDIRFKLHFRPALLMMAAVAVLLLPVSCKDHDVYVEDVIGMSTFHAGTRALVTNINDMVSQSVDDHTGFGVYGYKTKNSTNHTQIFTNQKVTATGTTDDYTWSYTPLKYWDMSAYYHFVAYWPHKTSEVTHVINGSDHTLTLTIPNWQPSATGDDWMIATHEGEASTYVNNSQGIVNFEFNHLLAQIEIRAWYYGNKEIQPTVTSINFGSSNYQVPASTAPDNVVTVSKEYSNSNSGLVWTAWNDVKTTNTVDLVTSNKVVAQTAYSTDASGATFTPENNSNTTDLVCQWLVIPFDTDDRPITVAYNIGEAVQVPVTLSPIPDDGWFGNLESGKKYTLTLKFNTVTNSLEPVLVVVKDWSAVTDLNNDSQSNDDDERYNW